MDEGAEGSATNPRGRRGSKSGDKPAKRKRVQSAKKSVQSAKRRTARARTPQTIRPILGTKIMPRSKKPSEERLSLFERVRIGQELVLERSKKNPATWATLSKRYGIPDRTLQHVLDSYLRQAEMHADNTGQAVLDETLHMLGQIIEHNSHLAVNGENTSAQVGAARTVMIAMRERVVLLAGMGKIPRSYRAVNELQMMTVVIRRFCDLLEKHRLPQEVIDEFYKLVDEIHPVIEGHASVALPRSS